MLVVADEPAARVRRKCRLAGSAEAEEQGDVAAILVDVRGAVHREDALGREQIVQRGEDRLFDLTCVFGAADEDRVSPEVDEDEGLAVGSVDSRVGLDRWQGDDGEVGLESHQLVGVGADKQVAREQAVPRVLGDHADAQAVTRVGAGRDVLRVHLVGPGVVLHARQQRLEACRGDWLVAGMPPDGVSARGLLDEELILGRAAGVLAGLGRQGSRGDDGRLVAPDGVLVEGGWA